MYWRVQPKTRCLRTFCEIYTSVHYAFGSFPCATPIITAMCLSNTVPSLRRCRAGIRMRLKRPCGITSWHSREMSPGKFEQVWDAIKRVMPMKNPKLHDEFKAVD